MHSNGVDKEQWNELFKVFMLSKQMASEIFKVGRVPQKEFSFNNFKFPSIDQRSFV